MRVETEVLGWVDLNAKIVPAGSEAGKVHERLDGIGAEPGEGVAAGRAR